MTDSMYTQSFGMGCGILRDLRGFVMCCRYTVGTSMLDETVKEKAVLRDVMLLSAMPS